MDFSCGEDSIKVQEFSFR